MFSRIWSRRIKEVRADLLDRTSAMLTAAGGEFVKTLLALIKESTPARVSQVMALLGLAPDIQEAILFLPRPVRGRDPIQMYDLLTLTVLLDWKTQRCLWERLVR